MGAYFLNTWQAALTSQEVLECLEFQEEDNDKEANYFLVKPFRIGRMVCVEMLYNNDDDVCLHVYDLS